MKRALPFLFALLTCPAVRAGDVIIDEVWNSAKVIVYELPDPAGRAEAIRYLESVRDRFKQGSEIVDGSASTASLREKLKGGFILYTTLSDKSKLLEPATRGLGLQMSGGEFRWHEVKSRAADAKVILVARNPFSRGYCTIWAAGSNRGLAGIDEIADRRSSYQIFHGDQLLREGNYDQNFVSIEHLSKAAALEDLNQFFATLKRAHPNLLKRVSEADYRRMRELTVARVRDGKDEVPIGQFASLLYNAAAFFQDGHTFAAWVPALNQWNTRGRRFPAWRLHFDNGRFVVAAAKDESITGMEIVSVNGTPVKEFLRPAIDGCSGETYGFRVSRFLWDEPLRYYLTDLFSSAGPYTLKLKGAGGQEREAPLETTNFEEYRAHHRDGWFQPNSQGTAVEFFDSGATAHFLYSSFHSSADERHKVDQIFADMQSKGTRNLIVDLRGNGGGASDMGEYIFEHIYAGKFRAMREVKAKASIDALHDVPWWARPLMLPLTGHVVGHSIGEHQHRKPQTFFGGRTYLLIDNGSFSMATMFATMFRDYKVGTTLGYETGGTPLMFGGPHWFALKNSRIVCAVAWTVNLPPMVVAGDDQHGVLPDVPLSDEKLAEFHGEKDPVLAFTLRYIRDHSSRSADMGSSDAARRAGR